MNGDKRRPGPAPMLMTGPLAPHEVAVRTSMTSAGYAPSSILEAARAMRRLSEWMNEANLTVAELSPLVLDCFLVDRRSRCHTVAASRRWISPVLRALRGLGVVPDAEPVVATGRELLLGQFRCWLRAERGLATESVRCYSGQASKFLAALPDPLWESLAALDAAAVTTFILAQAKSADSVWSAKAQITGTRALLRFLHVQGLIPVPLTAAVPGSRVGGWPRCRAV